MKSKEEVERGSEENVEQGSCEVRVAPGDVLALKTQGAGPCIVIIIYGEAFIEGEIKGSEFLALYHWEDDDVAGTYHRTNYEMSVTEEPTFEKCIAQMEGDLLENVFLAIEEELIPEDDSDDSDDLEEGSKEEEKEILKLSHLIIKSVALAGGQRAYKNKDAAEYVLPGTEMQAEALKALFTVKKRLSQFATKIENYLAIDVIIKEELSVDADALLIAEGEEYLNVETAVQDQKLNVSFEKLVDISSSSDEKSDSSEIEVEYLPPSPFRSSGF